jgi:hypothetical protein
MEMAEADRITWLYETGANHQFAVPVKVSEEEVKSALTITVSINV